MAYTEHLGDLEPDPREVEVLIEAPVDRLLSPDALKRGPHHVHTLGRTMEVAYFDVQGHMVWGATAMILTELRELIRRHG